MIPMLRRLTIRGGDGLGSSIGWVTRRRNGGTVDKSPQIWQISRKLLAEYSVRLDTVYDDPAFPVAGRHNRVYYWNESA